MDIIEKAAKAAHEAIKVFNESLGDTSLLPWDETPNAIKLSAIDGVKYLMKNPDADGKTMHTNWMKFKVAQGWSYGSKKDQSKKEHPSIQPYENLQYSERMKDDIFISIVKAHLSLMDT